jgi:energy-coupling factor transporter ATP-binding protein EcfA2
MISIPAGTIKLWPDFCMLVPEQIILREGTIYHLTGNNGSGKSSLIRNYLLGYESREPVYRLYFEQQMTAQMSAVRAFAAFGGARSRVHSEEDVVNILLEDLACCMAIEPRPVWVFVDESRYLDRILCHPGLVVASKLVVFCEHGNRRSGCERLSCRALAPDMSELRYGGD